MWKLPDTIELKNNCELDLSYNIREVLYRRGYKNTTQVIKYLYPDELPDPLLHFPDLKKASERIKESILLNSEIAISGDYDADGMTSTALIVDVLRKLNGRPYPIIPSRIKEGYGLNKSIIDLVQKRGIKLIITVDNGVSAVEELEYAKSQNIDVIVTDHHKINNKLDDAFAVVHPEKTPYNSPYKSIAGVGVAFVLAQAVSEIMNVKDVLNISKDLLCIGTIADMAALNGANRYWLKSWVKNLAKTECKGLRALIKSAKITQNKITSKDISFKIAPRINSIGRIDDPKRIINLFLEEDEEEILSQVKECEDINKRRRNLCGSIETEALNLLEKSNSTPSFILLAQSHWHHGVIGIVASRVMEKYSRPTAILSSDGSGTFRGSVRSPEGFNVIETLKSCSDLIEKYGGHQAAGGFTIKAENIIPLEEKLNLIADKWLSRSRFKCNIKPESLIQFKNIDSKLLHELTKLEPFGIGNPKPIFWSRCIEVTNYKYGYFGQISLKLKQNDITFEGVIWKKNKGLVIPQIVDIVFSLDYKHIKNDIVPILEIIDFREYAAVQIFKNSNRTYKCYQNDIGNIILLNEQNIKIEYDYKKKEISSSFIDKENNYIKYLLNISIDVLGIRY